MIFACAVRFIRLRSPPVSGCASRSARAAGSLAPCVLALSGLFLRMWHLGTIGLGIAGRREASLNFLIDSGRGEGGNQKPNLFGPIESRPKSSQPFVSGRRPGAPPPIPASESPRFGATSERPP